MQDPQHRPALTDRSFNGYISLLTSYIVWGLFPLYWQLLSHVSPLEITMHRVLWSIPVLAILVHTSVSRRADFTLTIRTGNELKMLAITSVLITLNWGIYVWAVSNALVVEASMGYFLSPLLHILAGVFVFKEKLKPVQWLALFLAAAGVILYMIAQGKFPWVGIGVATSFAAYGVLRKKIQTKAIVGLYTETLMIGPFALAVILYLHTQGSAHFLESTVTTDGLLILTGLVTVVPLGLIYHRRASASNDNGRNAILYQSQYSICTWGIHFPRGYEHHQADRIWHYLDEHRPLYRLVGAYQKPISRTLDLALF